MLSDGEQIGLIVLFLMTLWFASRNPRPPTRPA